MSIGNILGSCICNILLILGLTSLFNKIPIDDESKIVVLPLTIISMFIILIFGNMNLEISRIEGLMLLGLFAIFIIYIIYKMLKSNEKIDNTSTQSNFIKNILYLILGIIGLKFGGDFVVNSATTLARNFNISESVIALTIISIGTSLPELVTGIVAGYKGNSLVALGNILRFKLI